MLLSYLCYSKNIQRISSIYRVFVSKFYLILNVFFAFCSLHKMLLVQIVHLSQQIQLGPHCNQERRVYIYFIEQLLNICWYFILMCMYILQLDLSVKFCCRCYIGGARWHAKRGWGGVRGGGVCLWAGVRALPVPQPRPAHPPGSTRPRLLHSAAPRPGPTIKSHSQYSLNSPEEVPQHSQLFCCKCARITSFRVDGQTQYIVTDKLGHFTDQVDDSHNAWPSSFKLILIFIII